MGSKVRRPVCWHNTVFNFKKPKRTLPHEGWYSHKNTTDSETDLISEFPRSIWCDYFLTTDETRRFQYLLFLLFLAPQVSKRVNDDTKDEVQDNDDDHEEEQQVVDYSGSKKGLLLNTNT